MSVRTGGTAVRNVLGVCSHGHGLACLYASVPCAASVDGDAAVSCCGEVWVYGCPSWSAIEVGCLSLSDSFIHETFYIKNVLGHHAVDDTDVSDSPAGSDGMSGAAIEAESVSTLVLVAARGASRPPEIEVVVSDPMAVACLVSVYVVVTEHPDVGVSLTSCL